ncbi:hypothetical protein RD792_008880 [Penstemon davidsonii]|uniref:BHLH domain-containing protein n=1 Tax=Penstemon davidsonii TaxID=160366 RepID=A0ABR0DAC9_9LAMI|nr:hypothetical protein RD792_008880 [Penstemon davidsonii]
MLSRANSMVWMESSKDDEGEEEEEEGEEETSSWIQNNDNVVENKEDIEMGSLSTFKSMLEAESNDWYIANPTTTSAAMHSHLFLQPLDSYSTACSPTPSSSVFNNNLDFDSLIHNQVNNNYFLPPTSSIDTIPNNPPLVESFDFGCESGYLESVLNKGSGIFSDFGDNNNNNNNQFGTNNGGFSAFGFGDVNSFFFNRSNNKILKPLDNFDSIGAQPTLFQKRAALRNNNIGGNNSNGSSLNSSVDVNNNNNNCEVDEMKSSSSGDDSIDGSNLDYDSDDQLLENGSSSIDKNGGSCSNANGDLKGKKKGIPAKNLMAERRRRKKLNDRLYRLRSVVPKISKMDRASILGDAIEYLKELLQDVNDLQNELESTSSTPTTALYPLSPMSPGLSNRIKEELCTNAFASPLSSPTTQPATVEVRLREGEAVNIHMFCACRPGLLLSTMRAMDNLGLDIQQAVISCFNGFSLDIFRAEQSKEGQELNPDQIKAVLLDSAGFNGMIIKIQ